ncbi:octopamine/tyramine receptor, partial [Aphelenchoides avenae]
QLMRLFALLPSSPVAENASQGVWMVDEEQTSQFTAWQVLYTVGVSVAGFCTLFCVFANALTIFVLVRHPPLQKSISNLYILSLSVADVLIGLLVMSVLFVNDLLSRSPFEFFGPVWLCKTWQMADILLSTVSLYSTCAIALDRVWNLEKPLRVFKRSRRIAKRLVMCIWVLPLLIWVPVQIALFEWGHTSEDGSCLSLRQSASLLPLIAIPVLYVPAITLIAMFVRISLVVHRHLWFLKKHSTIPQIIGVSPMAERSSSLVRDNSLLRTPDFGGKKKSYDSITTLTSGYCTAGYTTALRTPRSGSPFISRPEWALAPLSEERSSGRERSHSEQINLIPEPASNLDRNACLSHSKIATASYSAPTRKESIIQHQLELIRRAEEFFRKNNGNDSGNGSGGESCRLPRKPSYRSRQSSSESTATIGSAAPVRILRKVSALSTFSRNGSNKFSVIGIPGNLADLLQREGISQQVKAAKAVALITCCFLICWFPFLILWPTKVYC